MKGHLGAVLTTGLMAMAFLLLLLQAVVLLRTTPRPEVAISAPVGRSSRFSMPGGRSGIPWQWQEDPRARPAPAGQAPQSKPPAERQRATPPRRNFTPEQGPRPARRAVA